MTPAGFPLAMARRPSRPFTLVPAEGRRFAIDEPTFAAIDRRGSVVIFRGPDNTCHEIDSRSIVELVAQDGDGDEERPR